MLSKRDIVNWLFVASFPLFGMGTYVAASRSPSVGFMVCVSAQLAIILFYLIDERAHDVERDVGLQHRAAYLAQRRVDIRLRQRTAPGQAIENSAKSFRQTVEHSGHPFDPSFETRPPGAPQDEAIQNTFAPEGALRCRAVAAGLQGQSASLHYGSVESGRKLGLPPREVKELRDLPLRTTYKR